MITREMRDSYNSYLQEHISNVRIGLGWIADKLPELVREYDSETLGEVGAIHDSSKWHPEEWDAYCEYFYGEYKTAEIERDFNYAWLHHQHVNPHHWQHWLLKEDSGSLIPMEMPKLCVIEMIADWWAFSWKANNLYEIFNWYDMNKDKMILHDTTKKLVEDILAQLKTKLDEVHTNGYEE